MAGGREVRRDLPLPLLGVRQVDRGRGGRPPPHPPRQAHLHELQGPQRVLGGAPREGLRKVRVGDMRKFREHST